MLKDIPKTKAEDYLREFANQSDGLWMHNLVDGIVNKRRLPELSVLDSVYGAFCFENGLSGDNKKIEISKTSTDLNKAEITTTDNENIILESLKHNSGVNAINQGEKITFHPKLTVIFGKNGSGKSGFVRIIKKISGSRTQEDIWQNIHSLKSKNHCDVEITFKKGNKERTLQWAGEGKSTSLNQLNVFDGKCIQMYLTKSLDFTYQPYGFELFPMLSTSLKELQARLTLDIQKKELNKPSFDNLFDETTKVGTFISSLGPGTKKEDLDKLPKWDNSLKRELFNKEKEMRSLHNLDQKLENLQNRLQKLNALQEQLDEIQNEFSAKNINLYTELIKNYIKRKRRLDAKKGKTLEDYDISEMDSEEWQKFIQAGEEYVESLDDEHYPKMNSQCIYCRQKLTKTAVKLIRLYRDLFREQEKSDFDDAENKLEEKLSELENTSYLEEFAYEKSDFEKILSKKQVFAAFTAME